MAEYRTIQTKIWDDEWFSELKPDAKVFFIYLITNHRASVAGIYKLPIKSACFECGLSRQRIEQLYEEFAEAGKVYHENGVVWVVKLRNYQSTQSSKVQIRIDKDLSEIPDCKLKSKYLSVYDTKIYPIRDEEYPIFDEKYPSRDETETDKETETETDTETTPLPPKGDALFTEEFEKYFWVRYPKSGRVAKPKALTAFIKARRKADLDTIMNGLLAYHRVVTRVPVNERDFVPAPAHATTWLNQERWNDLPLVVEEAKPTQPKPQYTNIDEILFKEYGHTHTMNEPSGDCPICLAEGTVKE